MLDVDERVATKGAITRTKILEAAIELFAARGYDGASIRDIEQKADVNRGLITYHFGNKEDIWKAAFDHAFLPYLNDLQSKAAMLQELDAKTRLRLMIGHFVRTSAHRPYMNQLMIQENYEASWRTEWIVERYLKPGAELNRTFAGSDAWVMRLETDPHFRYILLGACAMPFSLTSEATALYGVDVFSEEFIDKHIETVLKMIEPLFDTSPE